MSLFLRILSIIMPVLLVVMIGFWYAKYRKPDASALNRMMSELFFPLLIFASMSQKDFSLLEHRWLFVACGILILGSWGIAVLVAKRFHYNQHAFVPPMIFPNVANMGIPLTLMAFGEAMLPAVIALSMMYNLAHYTLGVRLCAPQASLKTLLRSPMLFAALSGIAVSIFKIPMPEWMLSGMMLLGQATIPLGLFALGIGFSRFSFKSWRIGVIGAVVRPLSGLIVAVPLTYFLPLSSEQRGVLLLYAALPPAVLNYIFAEEYRQNPELVSAIVVTGNLSAAFFVALALSLAL